jgi:hypothetical protein
MPFDGTHFDPNPSPPRKPDEAARVAVILAVALGLLLLLAPIPFAAWGDLAAYLTHHR